MRHAALVFVSLSSVVLLSAAVASGPDPIAAEGTARIESMRAGAPAAGHPTLEQILEITGG
ncbi:MAG: hypothetical protein VYC34_05335, partial [Planctomycetota bacterium]|nr:hypothetical protein [Planctomycetota bacterium]